MSTWINCEVMRGMFPSEYSVLVKDADGNEFGHLFADRTLVKVDKPVQGKDSVPGQLRVHAFMQKGDTVCVMLPESTWLRGRYMRIPISQLRY